jgi:hypothetical protein
VLAFTKYFTCHLILIAFLSLIDNVQRVHKCAMAAKCRESPDSESGPAVV